ncbi:hypothetical protein PR202_ga24357 [Eleusine coracana subsp. coracana]|uniref:Uncharacterized protein n=1 Tax=Eleusine coracana subsp. coracana TaxID=191504 RepID=A0AAV5D7H0_ELECO|nr:hypothetical protein PR202_ga24357 [Eleusine coracana subsp. coracana]
MTRKSPKKATATKSSYKLEISEQLREFSKSNISTADLNKMVEDGILLEQSRIDWKLRKKEAYINVPLKTGNSKDEWFYCDNPPPILADFSGAKAVHQARWLEKPDPTDPQVVASLEKIIELKNEGIDGITIEKSFIVRRVQPLKKQSRPAWDYATDDEMREVLDTYVSHPPVPSTDSEGPDYVKKPSQTGTGGASSSAVTRPTEEVVANISTAPPIPDLPSPSRRVKQTAHRHRQYVEDDDDDEEERCQDASLPTPAHSDRPSSQSEPPSKPDSGVGVAKKTDEAAKTSLKRKDSDPHTTSIKKKVCRIKIKQASGYNSSCFRFFIVVIINYLLGFNVTLFGNHSGRSSDTQSAQRSQDTRSAPGPRPTDLPQPVRTPSSAQTKPRKSPNAPVPKPLLTAAPQTINPSPTGMSSPRYKGKTTLAEDSLSRPETGDMDSAEITWLKKELEETKGKIEEAKSIFKSFKCNLTTISYDARKALDYIHANQVEKTGHSLEYLLEHAPEVIAKNTKKVVTEAGSQVLAICQSWSPALLLDKVKEDFNPDLTIDQCQLLMDSMLETSHALVDNVEVDPIASSPPATLEVELQDDASSPSQEL